MQNQNHTEDQQNLPNFGQGSGNNLMFAQSAYTPSTQTIRMNHQMESNGQPMFRSTASPMHIDLIAAQQQFQQQQNHMMGHPNNQTPNQQYQNQVSESPYTPPRKHPLISNSNTNTNTNNTTAVTKMRGYTPTPTSGKVPNLPLNQQMGSAISNVPFNSTAQREPSPMNNQIPMVSYNKALDSVAILGNEFEQTIKAFENVQEELALWRERYQKISEELENKQQEEQQVTFQAQQRLEQANREIEKLNIIVEGVNQKLEFNSQKMKTLERKCQDYGILEQKYNNMKVVNREQEAKIKVLETELNSARELIEMKDREIVDLEVYKREYADVQEKLQQLEKENNDLKHNIQDRDKTIEQQLNAIEHLSNLNSQLEQDNHQFRTQLDEYEREVDQVHDEIDLGLIVASSNMNTSNNLQSQQYMVDFGQNEQNLHISHPHGDHTLQQAVGEFPQDVEGDEQQGQELEQQPKDEGSEYEEVEIEVQEEVVVAEEDHEGEDEDEEDEDDEEEDESEDEEKQPVQEFVQYHAAAPTQYGVQSGYQQHPDETVHTLREQQFTQEPQGTVRNVQHPQMYMTQQQPQHGAQNQYYSQHGGQPVQQFQQGQQQQIHNSQPIHDRQSASFQQSQFQPQQQQQEQVYASQNYQYANNNNNTLNIPPEYMDVQNPLYSSVDQSVQSSVQSQGPQQMQNQSFSRNQEVPAQYSTSPRKASFGIQSNEQQEQVQQQVLAQYSQDTNQGVSRNNLDTLHSQHSSVAQMPSQYMTPQQFEEQQIQFSLQQSQNVQQQQPTTSQIIRQQQHTITQSAKTPLPTNNLAQADNNRMAQTAYTPQQQQQTVQAPAQQQQTQPNKEFHRQQCIQESQHQDLQENNASFSQQPQQVIVTEQDNVTQISYVPQQSEDSHQVEGADTQYQQSQVNSDDTTQRRISDINSQRPQDNLRQTASVVIQTNQEFNPNTQFYSQKLPQFQVSPKQVQSLRGQQQPLLPNQSVQQSQYIQESVYEQQSEVEQPEQGNYRSAIQHQNQYASEQMQRSAENVPYGHSSQELVIQGVSVLEENHNPTINATTSIIQDPQQGAEVQHQQVDQQNVNVNKLGRGSLKITQPQQQQQPSQLNRGSVQLNNNQPQVNVKNLMEAHQQAQAMHAQQAPQGLEEIQEENLQSQIQNIQEESQQDPNSMAASASQPHHLLEQEQQHFAQQGSITSSKSSERSQTQTMQQPPIQVSQNQMQNNSSVQPQESSTILDQTDEEPLQISTSQFNRQQNSVQHAPQMVISAIPESEKSEELGHSQVHQAQQGVGQGSVEQISNVEIQQQNPSIPHQQPIQQTQSVYVGNNQQQPGKFLKSVPVIITPNSLQVPGQQQQQQLDSSQLSNPQIQMVQSQQGSQVSSNNSGQVQQIQPQPSHLQQSIITTTNSQVQEEQPVQRQQQQLALPQSNISQTQSVYIPANQQQVQQHPQAIAQSQPLQQGQFQSFGPAQNQTVSQVPSQQGQSVVVSQAQPGLQQSQQQQPITRSEYVQQEGPVESEENEEILLSFEQHRSQQAHDVQGGATAPTFEEQQQQQFLQPQNGQTPLQTQSVYVPQNKQGGARNMAQSQPLVPQQRHFENVNQILEQPLEEEQGTQYQPQQSASVYQSAAPQQPAQQQQQQQQQHQPQFISQSQVQQQPTPNQGQLFHSQAQRPIQGLQAPQQGQQAPLQQPQHQQPIQQSQHQSPVQQSQVQVPVQQSQHQVPIQQSQQQVPIKQSQLQVPVQQSQQQGVIGQSQVPIQQSQQQHPVDASQQQRILPTQSVIVHTAQPSQLQNSVESQNSQPRQAISTMSGAPISATSIPQQRQGVQQQLPGHLQTQSYYIPQQPQSAISFSGFTQQSSNPTPQYVQSQYDSTPQLQSQQQQPVQNTNTSLNDASISAIPPTSQVFGSTVAVPIGASQVDKKKKKKNKKKNMAQSEAIVGQPGIEDSQKVKKSMRPLPTEGSESSMSKTSIPMTKTVVTTKKVLVKKKKSMDVSQSQSSIKKSGVSNAAAPASISSNMSKTQVPPRQVQTQQQALPQFGRTTSQQMESSTPLSPPSTQNKQDSQQRGIKPSMTLTSMPGMPNKSVSMLSSQSKDNRKIASGQNNMLNKVIQMKNQLAEKNTEIDQLKLRIDENLKQIEALSGDNGQLNEHNIQLREELEQVQKQLQENFEFHKSEIDNLRQEYENTIAPLLQEKQNLEESNLALSKQCEAFDIALQNSDEEKQRAIRELINEKEQLQNFSEVILREKESVRHENLSLKDEQARRIKLENQLIKDNEDLKNLSSSQSKDIDTWKVKYKNLKKEINGLRLQFDSYKNQILHEIQSQIQDRATNFQGVLTSIKKKYHDQGDSTLSSHRDMIIQQDQQEHIQAPAAFNIPMKQQQPQQQQFNNQMSHSQQYHPYPQQQQYTHHQMSQSQPQPSSHQKSHSVHSYAPVHTTEFTPNPQQNDEQFINELKYKINALKQTQAEQEALQIKSQQQLQSIQMHQAIQQQFMSAQKPQHPQQFENSDENTISEHNQEDSQQLDPIQFNIEQLITLKNQYEQALGRVNTSMSPKKRQ